MYEGCRAFHAFFSYFCYMFLTDTHTHLYVEEFDADRESVVRNAVDQGIKRMLLPNIDRSSLKAMLTLSDAFPNNCFPMMGLHPTSVNSDYEQELERMEGEIPGQSFCGVGEIGIDLYWDQTFKEQQIDAFRRQLRTAKKYQLGVSIHTRNAFDLTLNIVKEELTDELKGVFHCFTAGMTDARKIMDTGFKMGIGGIVTFKNGGLSEILKEIPLEHLVLETDSPYLTPVPFRGKRNQSAYLRFIAQKIAEIKGISREAVAEVTNHSAEQIFSINEV